LAFIAIGSIIAFIVSYRYRQLLEVEKIRTKISADLHDSIGSGLSEITILSEILNRQPNVKQEDLQSGLKNISVTARSLVGNMSDIVWLVNPSKDSLKDLLLRLQDSYQEVFAQANISFKLNGIENLELIHLPLTYRQHLFLLFKEAVNNSLKYSECTKIDLTIDIKGKNLNIIYKENGKGFDLKSKDEKGNGLTNMKNRAKAISGNCQILSEINKGTQIIFTGKISK
jgi:signal transduction histidine kinase